MCNSVVDAYEMIRAAGLVPYGPQFEPAPAMGTIVAQDPEPPAHVEPPAPVVLWTDDRRGAADRVPAPAGTVNAALAL